MDPTIDMETPVREQIKQMNVATYFNRLASLMKDNPPAKADKALLKKMALLGIVPGQPFDINKLTPAEIESLGAVPEAAFAKMKAWFNNGAKPSTRGSSQVGAPDGTKDSSKDSSKDSAEASAKVSTKAGDSISRNGWHFSLKTGVYGTDYIQRALIAAFGLGANLQKDTFYAISVADGVGQPYSGNFRYVLHFPPGQGPNVNAFWSLTMYDADYFFVENALGRYTLGSRDGLKLNGDGSLDIYLQRHPPPPALESNWLPAAEEKFILMLRFYWPKETMLNGSWKIPPVKRGD